MFGYKDFNEIYLDSSPHFRVEDISIPVVAMNAADDPFCPEFGMHYVVLFLVIFEIHQIIMHAWSQAVTFLNRKLHLHNLCAYNLVVIRVFRTLLSFFSLH